FGDFDVHFQGLVWPGTSLDVDSTRSLGDVTSLVGDGESLAIRKPEVELGEKATFLRVRQVPRAGNRAAFDLGVEPTELEFTWRRTHGHLDVVHLLTQSRH